MYINIITLYIDEKNRLVQRREIINYLNFEFIFKRRDIILMFREKGFFTKFNYTRDLKIETTVRNLFSHLLTKHPLAFSYKFLKAIFFYFNFSGKEDFVYKKEIKLSASQMLLHEAYFVVEKLRANRLFVSFIKKFSRNTKILEIFLTVVKDQANILVCKNRRENPDSTRNLEAIRLLAHIFCIVRINYFKEIDAFPYITVKKQFILYEIMFFEFIQYFDISFSEAEWDTVIHNDGSIIY